MTKTCKVLNIAIPLGAATSNIPVFTRKVVLAEEETPYVTL